MHDFHKSPFPPTDRRGECKHSPQRAGSTWTSVAYGESQFSPLASVLWAPTLHQSRCQGPFLCSFGTGQHFLQENKSVKSLAAPRSSATCSQQRSVFMQWLVLAYLLVGGEKSKYVLSRKNIWHSKLSQVLISLSTAHKGWLASTHCNSC